MENGKAGSQNGGTERKGYIVAESDGAGYIAGVLHIERDDSLNMYPNDDAAARAAEKDGVKLIYRMPYVPDGVYLDTPENREAISQAFEAHRLSLPADAELRQRLEARLDDCYSRWESAARMRDKEVIFDDAESIAATRQSYGYFRNDHEFTTGQAEFLLGFENPLELLSDHWAERPLLDVQYTVEAVFSDKARTLEHGGYKLAAEMPAATEPAAREPLIRRREDGTTSVLDALRRARENPPEHKTKPEHPGRNKHEPDL
jgi:hypothetical protein